MKKILFACLLVISVTLTGCSSGPIIRAASDAVPYERMPATPPGLVEPEPEGYAKERTADNITVLTGESDVIVCEYAVAPDNSSAVFSEAATNEKRRHELAKQYAVGLDGSAYAVSVKSFFDKPGLLISGVLKEDMGYGKAGETAVYAVVPYGEYFLMVSAFAPESTADFPGEISAFLDSFAIDNAPAPAV